MSSQTFTILLLAAMFVWSAEPPAATFGPRGAFRLESSKDGSVVRSHGVTENLEPGGHTKFYPLPQSTLEEYIKLRPADVKLNPITATAGIYERDEMIGPHQIEGNKLWFGKNFYDGEGERGVGAFGFFDASTRSYQLFSPPEAATCETSAILVETEVVWVALDHSTEDISTFPCGLVRWNKSTHAVEPYDTEFVITKIARNGESLKLTTNGGFAMLTNGVLSRFLITAKPGGKPESSPIARFPAPPSHY